MARYGRNANRTTRSVTGTNNVAETGATVTLTRELSTATGKPVFDNCALYYQNVGTTDDSVYAVVDGTSFTVAAGTAIKGVVTSVGPHPDSYIVEATIASSDSITCTLLEW